MSRSWASPAAPSTTLPSEPALSPPCPRPLTARRYLHTLIECLRIAFSDAHWWIADPAVESVPVAGLLDKVRA